LIQENETKIRFSSSSKWDSLLKLKLTGFLASKRTISCSCGKKMAKEAEFFGVRSTTLFIPFTLTSFGKFNNILEMTKPLDAYFPLRFHSFDRDRKQKAYFSLAYIGITIKSKKEGIDANHMFCIGRFLGELLIFDNLLINGMAVHEPSNKPLNQIVLKHFEKLNNKNLSYDGAWISTVVYGRRQQGPQLVLRKPRDMRDLASSILSQEPQGRDVEVEVNVERGRDAGAQAGPGSDPTPSTSKK